MTKHFPHTVVNVDTPKTHGTQCPKSPVKVLPSARENGSISIVSNGCRAMARKDQLSLNSVPRLISFPYQLYIYIRTIVTVKVIATGIL